MCGEKSLVRLVQVTFWGSPPRVRGKADVRPLTTVDDRITPACAGKRNNTRICRCIIQDHPRVCGEKCYTLCKSNRRRGSPPRVRGKDVPVKTDDNGNRITPACAGKSL